MVEDAQRKHLDSLERLREAREFAEWSKKDREARLPELTDEQREQMQQYLRVVNQHGMSSFFEESKECVNCPVTVTAKKLIGTVRKTE